MQHESNQGAGPSVWQPPLLPGWTEHVAPGGQLYWHNQQLKQSTYKRPSNEVRQTHSGPNGTIPFYSGPPPGFSEEAPIASTASNVKERPKKKEAIPGADGWFRVRTNLGNIFYAHKESQRSEWIAPEEIREQLEAMEKAKRKLKQELALRRKEEKAQAERIHREEQRRKEEQERKRKEAERLKREEKRRKEREEEERIQKERLRTLQEVNKRKRENGEEEGENGTSEKKARSSIKDSNAAEQEDENEEDRQIRIAAEMAAETEIEDVVAADKELTAEQAKAIFMHMLTEMNGTSKEINPMAPWDKELSKFVYHRDYTVLKELSDKQDAFNEWCRLRLREKRAGKTNSKTSQKGEETVDITPQSDSSNRLAAYRSLLEGEVTSTRTHWDDFRKSWKRDRRFFAFGRDEREREKEFRNWLKELGERKRQAALRNENEFVQLLQDKLGSDPESRLDPSSSTSEAQNLWSKCKKAPGLDSDPRYDAVGSSSRRAVLFEEWAKGRRNVEDSASPAEPHQSMQENTTTKQVHRDSNNALRQREEEVARQRRLLQGEKTRTLGKALYEEGLTEYRQLLIDAVRDPLATFESAIDTLSRDDRFRAQALSQNERQRIFYEHVDHLNRRRLRSLEDVFEKYAPSLDTEREVALPLILDDEEIDRKQLTQLHALVSGSKTVGDLFDEWQARREQDSHKSFLQMLKENAFVDFWGSLRREHERKGDDGEKDAGPEETNLTNDEDEDANIPSLLQMAATIDLDEIHAVLRDDQRYRAFRHKPEMREEWIREYLQQMTVPKKTVFQR